MTRYGAQFGPDITFLGVDRGRPRRRRRRYADADVVVVGAPFDGGTSHRPGTRFGPQAIRQTDYLPHDGSRPHLALRVDALQDLRGRRRRRRRDVRRATIERVARPRSRRRCTRSRRRRDPAGARRRPLDRAARRHRRGPAPRLRPGLDDPLRRARRHRRHRVRLAVRPRPADAPADRVRRAARRPVPADRAARLLARPGDAGLDGRAGHAVLRDDRDRRARPRRLPRRGVRRSPLDDCDGVFLSVDIDVCDPGHAPGTGTPEPGGLSARAAARRRTPDLPASCPSSASTWSRCRRPTTTPRSPRSSPTGSCLEALSGLAARKHGITHDPAGPLLEGR